MRKLIPIVLAACMLAANATAQTPEEHYKSGIAFYKEKKYAEAIAEFTAAVEAKPDYMAAWYLRGLIKINLHDSSSISDFTRVIALKPDYYKAWHFRGLEKGSAGNFTGAISDLDSCLAIKPDFAESYFHRGDFKMQLKDYDGALKDEEKAVSLKADYVDAWYAKGLIESAKGDCAAAIADFDKTLSFNKAEIMGGIYFYKAKNEYLLNKKDAACQDYKKALDAGYQKAAAMISTLCN